MVRRLYRNCQIAIILSYNSQKFIMAEIQSKCIFCKITSGNDDNTQIIHQVSGLLIIYLFHDGYYIHRHSNAGSTYFSVDCTTHPYFRPHNRELLCFSLTCDLLRLLSVIIQQMPLVELELPPFRRT